MKIKVDSRKVKPGDTFIALKGLQTDGHDYVIDAISNGATTVVVEHGEYEVETIRVLNTRAYLIDVLEKMYGDQIITLKIVGITGTNGKTTSCYLLWQALNRLGIKCAYIGTIGFYMEKKVADLSNTTPDLCDIYEMFLTCIEAGYTCIVMEVSSHALDMNRLEGILFDYAVFTNLTKEHLDYHLDMPTYALAKQKLFYMLKEHAKVIINVDDEFHAYFLLGRNQNVTYGKKDSHYKIVNYNMDHAYSTFDIEHNKVITTYQSSLLGLYNIYNLLITIIILSDLAYKQEVILKTVLELKAPPGRMESIPYKTNQIIIDYAHTPDAVMSIIKACRELTDRHIYTIVGCGGNRDKMKRPEMGTIATDLSDYVIFTSDNPRNEDPAEILADMTNHLSNKNYEIAINRQKAIHKGVQMLEENDILLILGKGHEDYQVIGDKKTHFSDLEEVFKIIRR